MPDLSSPKRKGRTRRRSTNCMKINKTYTTSLSTANNQIKLTLSEPTKSQTNAAAAAFPMTPLTPSTEKESNVYQYSDDGEMMVDDDGMHCFIENMDHGSGGVLIMDPNEEKEKEKVQDIGVMNIINEETQNAISELAIIGEKETKKIESSSSTDSLIVGDGQQVVDGDWHWDWDFDFDDEAVGLGLGLGLATGEGEEEDNILSWPWEENMTTDNIAAWLLS